MKFFDPLPHQMLLVANVSMPSSRTNSLLFLSNDEVKAAHSDFDRCPRGGGLRPEIPPDQHFSQPYFTI